MVPSGSLSRVILGADNRGIMCGMALPLSSQWKIMRFQRTINATKLTGEI